MGRLTGGTIGHVTLEYPGNHIGLGRQDGILQFVDHEDRAKPKYTGGRKAARIKAGIVRMSLGATAHPAFGLPKRKHRLATASDAQGAGLVR